MHAVPLDRAAINRANAQHSTGPRTAAGKQRSSLNAIRHGLTACTAVLPTEDLAAYQAHIQQFLDEYKPATPTETQLVHDLANAAWRQNRIPLLEAELLSRALNPPNELAADCNQSMTFDIVDAHRALATLGLHGHRLSRQFNKALDQLRAIQTERMEREYREMKEAAALLELHKHKGIPWQPSDHGFVFSLSAVERFVERFAERQSAQGAQSWLARSVVRGYENGARLNEAGHIEHVLFHAPPVHPQPRVNSH